MQNTKIFLPYTSFFNNYCAKDLTTSGNIQHIRLRGGLSLLHKHYDYGMVT
jgi:hypothetical protein